MFFLSGIFDIWYWILSTWGIHYLLTPLQNSLSRNKQHSGVKRLVCLYFFSASHTFEQEYALFFCRFQNCQSTASQLLARHKSRFKGNSLIDKMPAMMPAQTDWEVSYKSNMLQCTCVLIAWCGTVSPCLVPVSTSICCSVCATGMVWNSITMSCAGK